MYKSFNAQNIHALHNILAEVVNTVIHMWEQVDLYESVGQNLSYSILPLFTLAIGGGR